METIGQAEYLSLREGAKVLEADHCGDKVLRLADGTILKLFRRKRWLSSAMIYPYAKRFVVNAKALIKRGVSVPHILRIARILSIGCDVVHYLPLVGIMLRELAQAGLDPAREAAIAMTMTAMTASRELRVRYAADNVDCTSQRADFVGMYIL